MLFKLSGKTHALILVENPMVGNSLETFHLNIVEPEQKQFFSDVIEHMHFPPIRSFFLIQNISKTLDSFLSEI